MKEQHFQKLVNSIEQASQVKRGLLPPSRVFEIDPENIRAIREKSGKSQSEFALMIGVSISTLQNREQGRRRPEGPARALLKVSSTNPEVVTAASTR